MTDTDTSEPPRAGWTKLVPIPEHVQREAALCGNIDGLHVSLNALRIALEAADRALGLQGIPDERGKPSPAAEMRATWCAASRLLHAAVDSTERDGKAVIAGVSHMLALE